MQKTYRAAEEMLRSYLPATLVEGWGRRPQQSALWGTWLEGSLMFCDISGFTAMSESLAQVGKEGAELMAAVLNRFFERMLAIADDWGGVQMKFGGDAMVLYFSDQGHAERAAAAGLDMQSAMTDFRRVAVGGNDYRLRMRIAIHSGRFFGASVGRPNGLLHYLLVGSDVNRTAQIEGLGQPGQVVMSPQAAAHMGTGSRLVQRDGVCQVRALERPPLPAPRHIPLAPGDILKQYILPALTTPLAQGDSVGVSGEHRRVTVVFINLLGISELLDTRGDAEALAEADTYVKMVMGAMERHGGFLAASDLASEGDKLICLFGAPVSVEHEETAALRAVIDLDRELGASSLSLRHRIGVSSGFVFAGEIGSSRRREYTVIGDSVNLAARLMAASRPGEILASKPTVERAGNGFDVQRLRPLRVKGKAAPVPVFRLHHGDTVVQPHQAREVSLSPLVGRGDELATLLRLARQVTSSGRERWAYLWGEPGIGKSRLTQEVSSQLQAQGWQAVVASCQLHTWHAPYAPWREPLKALLSISSAEEPAEAWTKLNTAIENAEPDLAPFAPLLGELLSLPAREATVIASLDPKDRRRHLTSVIVALLDAITRQRPLILVFEDAHWADGVSLELLVAVVAARPRILAVITSREPPLPAELSAAGAPVSMHLNELPSEAARSLVASTSGLSAQIVDRVVAKAQGNPLFLQEMALSGIGRDESLPETVNDVILARLDRLPPKEKAVVRMASVIGPTFSLGELGALAGSAMDAVALQQALAGLRSLGFARQLDVDAPTHAFSHALTRDVAYETLPYAERRRLHRRAAQHIEERDAAQLESSSELLLHHYEVAADGAKIVRYAAMSGDRALAMFAVTDSLQYYERALSALSALGKGSEGDRSVLFERVGDCLEVAGRHREAVEKFAEALKEWREWRRRPRLVSALEGLRVRDAALCRKVGATLERSSEYEHAVRWLDEALSVLPPRAGRVGAQICASKSLTLYRRGRYEEAVHWGKRGLTLARHSRDARQLAYAHHILGNSYREIGQLTKALDHDRKAVRHYHQIGDGPGQARANSNLGLTYQMLSMFDAALYHYDVGLKVDERLGNVSHAAVIHNNIGEVLLAIGRLDEAVAHLEFVVSAHRADSSLAGLTGLAEVNLTRCLLLRGDIDGAKSRLRRGLRLLRSAGVEGLLTEAHLQRAELHLAVGDVLRARRECRRALRDIRTRETKVLEARAERLLGKVEASLGKTALARAHLRTSISIAHRTGAGFEEAVSLRELGTILHAVPATRARAAGILARASRILSKMGAALDPPADGHVSPG